MTTPVMMLSEFNNTVARLARLRQQARLRLQPDVVVQPHVQPVRKTDFGKGEEELGFCVVVGCRTKKRTARLCNDCAEFCCSRCKQCSTCRSFVPLRHHVHLDNNYNEKYEDDEEEEEKREKREREEEKKTQWQRVVLNCSSIVLSFVLVCNL